MERPAPLCVFDLDRTLLEDRTVLRLGEAFGVLDQVRAIWDLHRNQELAAGREETRAIAKLFAGASYPDFEAVCAAMPLRRGAREAVDGLRRLGFRIGVVSASYTCATESARERLGLDFGVGVELVVEKGRVTGDVEESRFPGPCGQHVCKERVLVEDRNAREAPFTVAVGDGANDVCMVNAADLGVALEPCHAKLRAVADVVIDDLARLPQLVAQRWPGPPVAPA